MSAVLFLLILFPAAVVKAELDRENEKILRERAEKSAAQYQAKLEIIEKMYSQREVAIQG